MQTLRAGHSNAEPKLFAPLQTHSVGDGHYLHLHTQFGEDRCTQFRVIVVTDTVRPPARPPQTQTHRQDWLQYSVITTVSDSGWP